MEIDQLCRLEALGHVLQRRTTYGGVGGGQGILFDAATGPAVSGLGSAVLNNDSRRTIHPFLEMPPQ